MWSPHLVLILRKFPFDYVKTRAFLLGPFRFEFSYLIETGFSFLAPVI
jgi:hypothetical protein